MTTTKLAAYVRSEQPRIDAALDAITMQLPPSARSVATHILHAGGKRLRPLLTILTARLFGCVDNDIYPLAATMEMVHAATLLHDDVIDNAASRRGQPAAHRRFGATRAILAGDALLARASLIVAGYNDLRLARCLAVTLEETIEGQILEMDQAGAHPDLDSYLAIIRGKTAWMLRACCEIGALRAGADEDAVRCAAEFGLKIGMAFQIVDDALDFAPAGRTGKPEGGDLREGKLTPPLHLYAASLPPAESRDFIRRCLARELGEADMARVVASVRDQGFDRAARNMADPYLEAARAALARLMARLMDRRDAGRPAGTEHALLEAVIRYVRDREL